MRAQITRDATGRIQTVTAPQVTQLMPPPRATWPDTWLYRDAEGLGRLPDGRLVVSYEGLHRVSLHDPDGAFAQWIVVAEDFARLEVNTGLEAVATRGDGTILALPEQWPEPMLPVFAFDGTWQVTAHLVQSAFRPVGLDLDSAGRLYVLDRRGNPGRGFASRIRRIDPENGSEEILVQTPFGRHGNLEGLSLWRRADGTLIATLITDDNGLRLQRREIVEYQLPP